MTDPVNDPNLADENTQLARERTLLANERTRLAAERTFSAWIRTGLTAIGGGFAVMRLLSFKTVDHQLLAQLIGRFLIVWGIVVFVFAIFSYLRSCKKLENTIGYKIPISGMLTIALALILLAVLLLIIVI